MDFTISEQEKKYLLKTARNSIASKFKNHNYVFDPPTENLKQPCGAFVTLTEAKNLRGCIGYIEAVKPLFETIGEMAVSAAFQDPRFEPLKESELEKIHIEISVLSPLEKITDPATIKVGVHGIYLRNRYTSGVLLPQVAAEYGWDRYTFLEQTCRKAGMPRLAWKDPDTKIFIFSAILFEEE